MIPVGVIAQGGATVPNAPTSFTATAVAGGRSVSLSWVAPSFNGGLPITSYTISRGGTAIHTTANGSTTSYTNTGLTPQTAYSYTVVANNLLGSSVTASANATTGIGNPDASTISIFTSYQNYNYTPDPDPEKDGVTTLYWTYETRQTVPNNNGSPLTSIVFERSNDNGATWFTYSTADSYYFTFYDFNVYSGESPYLVRAYFVNAVGNGIPSNALNIINLGQ